MRKALCLLTKIPNEIWLNFLDNFKEYDIFIIIDDNEIDYNEKYKNVYKNMKLIIFIILIIVFFTFFGIKITIPGKDKKEN